MSKKKILLAGSIDQSKIDKLKNIYKLDDSFTLNGKCDFNKFDFDIENFKLECNTGFHYILLLQSLNPRPVTLNEDLKTLSSVFPKEVLKERLVLLFVQKSDYKKKLEEIRQEIIEYFDVMYRYIGIIDRNERISFAENRIWLLESNSLLKYFFSKLSSDNKEYYYPIKLKSTKQLDQNLAEKSGSNRAFKKKIVTLSLPPNLGFKSMKKECNFFY